VTHEALPGWNHGPVRQAILDFVAAVADEAGPNSNGDLPMLQFTGGPSLPALRLLLLHDDAEREFAYVAGAERALETARAQGWTVLSMRDDWRQVFPDPIGG
jgi:hypothetical protein